MSNETIFRFLTIGTSLFIALAIFSAVMLYYNTVKESVSKINITDIASNYNENIKNILYKKEVTGAELKTILNYFFENKDVSIKIINYYAFNNEDIYNENSYKMVYVDLYNRDNFNQNNNEDYRNLMKNIIPNQIFSSAVTYDENSNIIYIELTLKTI